MANKPIDTNLSDIFGVDPSPPKYPVLLDDAIHSPPTDNSDDDFLEAVANLKMIIESGKRALNVAFDLAADLQDPKSWEAYNNIMKNLTEVNDRLVDLYKSREELHSIKRNASQPTDDKPGNNVQNNIFVGSTTELQKMVHNIKEKEKNTIDAPVKKVD